MGANSVGANSPWGETGSYQQKKMDSISGGTPLCGLYMNVRPQRVWFLKSILAISVSIRVWFLHSSLEVGIFLAKGLGSGLNTPAPLHPIFLRVPILPRLSSFVLFHRGFLYLS